MKDIPSHKVSLFLFRAGGYCYGVPAFQVRCSAKGFLLPEKLMPGLPWAFSRKEAEEASLLLHIRGEKEYLVPIESMDEVLEIALTEIRPFPGWLEPFVLLRRMWGLFIRHGRFYILLDFENISGQNDAMDAGTNDPKEAHTQELP